MIDLSYLTEEEQERILAVLKRDAELKKAEEQRIQTLQKSVEDKGQLKYLTGDWFYETKSRRHRDRIHGSDIIRASIRQRRPVAVMELSQVWADMPSLVNSDNQEVFAPPELAGLMDDPRVQPSCERTEDRSPSDRPQDALKPGSQSPFQQRQNPFNSSPTPATLEVMDTQLTNGGMEQTKTPDREPLLPSECSVSHFTSLEPHRSEVNNPVPLSAAPVPIPVPRKRTLISRSQDSISETDGSAARQASSHPPKGILKLSPGYSSDVSLQYRPVCSRLPPQQSPNPQDSPTKTLAPVGEQETLSWFDRKQVRFCSPVGHGCIEGSTEIQDGRELGEHGLLDLDTTGPSEGDDETAQADVNDYSEEVGQGDPYSPHTDRDEAPLPGGSPCWQQPRSEVSLLWSGRQTVDLGEEGVGGASYREMLTPQTQDTGSTQVPVDQHEHGHAESLDPQVSDFHLTDQESGKPDHPGSSTEEEGHSMANVREWFVWSLRQRAAPQTNLPEQPSDKPEVPVVATSDTKPPSDAGSKNTEESHAVSPKPRRGLLGMFSRGESPETQSPVEVSMSEERELGDATSNFNVQSAASTSVQPQSEFPGQLTDQSEILAAAISDAKSPSDAGSKKSPHTMSPKPRKGLLGIFRRRESKERSPEARSEVEEDATASEERQPQEVIANLTVSQSVSTTTQQYQQGTDTQTQSDETVETAVFQSKGAITSVISVETEDQHEVAGSGGEADKFPQKLSNLESFLEKESSDLNILTGKPSSDAMAQKPVFIGHGDPYDQKIDFNEDFPKTEIRKGSLCLLDSDPSARRKSDALENSNIAFSKIPCEDKSSPSVECSPLLNTPSVDGTFIARPILVVDEADSPPEGSTVKQQDELTTSLSVHPSGLSPKQQGGVPEPQLGLTPREQETKKENIVPFWKKENGGPRNRVDKPTEPADSQTQPCSEKPPVGLAIVLAFSDIGATERLRETEDHEESSSLYRSISSTAVSTAKDRIEKGFGSTDKPQSRSYNSLWDRHVDQQTPFNTETLPQDRLLSPITPLPRSRIPKLKDPTDDEVKRSPAKTCHPKALPREPTNHKGSGQDCSPLKTFPIDITPPSKDRAEDVEKTTLKVRQIKGSSHEAKPVVKPRVEIPSPSQPISIEQREQHHVTPPQRDSEQRSLTAKKPLPHPTQSIPLPATRTGLGSLNARQGPSAPHHRDPGARKDSEDGLIGEQLAIKELETPELAGTPGECESDLGSSLARPFVPKDVQRDVPPLDMHVPQDTNVPQGLSEIVAELDVGPNPTTGSLSESEESQHTESEESPHAERSPSSLGSSRSSTPTAQSGAASPGSYHAERSPMRDLKQISSKLKASSKSLEDVTSRITSSVLSPPSPVQLDQRRLSVSVPDLPQDQEERDVRDGDSVSECSFSLDGRATAGSLTNLSLSSGLASMSSISGSAVSVYNMDFGEVEVKGTVRFALNYVQKLAEFHIFVVHCRELAVAERKKNRSDPYVKCYLLPDKAKLGKRKTSVKKKTLNPTFNEILRFKVTMEALKAQKLNVSVWHNDSFGRNNFLGEVDLDFSTWDFSNTQMNDYALKPRVSTQTPAHPLSVDHRGEMRVALRFLQQASYSKRSPKTGAGEVQVWVKDCRNLPPVRGVVIDPFVKCTVLPDASRKGRQKTRVVKRTSSPMFNHTMAFQGFSLEDLGQACVEITVWDHDRLSNHFIGGLRVGPGTGTSYGAEVHWMDSTAEEAGLWERMTHSQSEWVEEVLPLRMLLMARGVAK